MNDTILKTIVFKPPIKFLFPKTVDFIKWLSEKYPDRKYRDALDPTMPNDYCYPEFEEGLINTTLAEGWILIGYHVGSWIFAKTENT